MKTNVNKTSIENHEINQLLGIGKLKTNGKLRCSVSGRVVWVLVA